ncbi:POK6 protein, partial [Ceuthmochares aereus]|nr:POK6 protein [Ceuthmochares aereus]
VPQVLWTIIDSQIQPQKLTIAVNTKTLHDVQRLLGDLQWLRPVVGIPNDDLEQLHPLLKGCDPALP